MLAMWFYGTFPCRMSFTLTCWERRKLGIAEFCRKISQAKKLEIKRKNFSVKSFRVQNNNFCFRGFVDDQPFIFKIDTGSDVSIFSRRYVKENKQQIFVRDCNLKYPTKKEVPVEVVLRKHSLEFPMFVAEIRDDCILRTDFLIKTGYGEIFVSSFGQTLPELENSFCA